MWQMLTRRCGVDVAVTLKSGIADLLCSFRGKIVIESNVAFTSSDIPPCSFWLQVFEMGPIFDRNVVVISVDFPRASREGLM